MLGALLAYPNQPMRAEHLAEIVWDGAPPQRALPTLRTYMTRLRQDLGPDSASRIVTGDRGYLAEVSTGELDALAFEELCGDAGKAISGADWPRAAEQAGQALALWRGDPLFDVPSQMLRDIWLPRLDQQRVQVTEWQLEAGLHLGQHESLVPRLRQLTADHPLRERFHGQLMRALARCGRQGEALAAYQEARKAIIDDLGVEPGPELRNLQEQILVGGRCADEPSTITSGSPGDPVPGAAAPAVVPPRQLPAGSRCFTGRHRELELLADLDQVPPPGEQDGTVAIHAIDGMAGIGKTALAVHAAHRLAGRFPDGQLFLDLHGYTPGRPAREPDEALGALLRGLGASATEIPAEAEERAALYRQRLAGTRTLIVLDNARDEGQVSPLLPGAPGCLVLVTSRRRLRGLHDAHVVALDVLPETDALRLLQAAGSVTVPADDPDLAELTRLCGGLPLALRVAGALLRHRPSWTPGYLAGLLRDERRRLAALSDGGHDLRAVFGLSYAGLGERQRLLFRRLALLPGTDCDAFAAAALLDAAPDDAIRLLEELVDHNLLIEHAPGRYRFHDLLRVHARELGENDPALAGKEARDRLLRYYAYTARAASALIAIFPPRPAPRDPAPCRTPTLTGPEDARAWLRSERENLEAAHGYARDHALDDHAVALAAGLAETLRADGPLTHLVDLHSAAAAIAGRHGWDAARATALTDLANARGFDGDLPGAADSAGRALETFRNLGERDGEASALMELGRAENLAGDLSGAVRAASRAREIFQELGSPHGEASALTDLANVQRMIGDLPAASDSAARALRLFRGLGNRDGEAIALTELGRAQNLAGDLAGASDSAARALEIFRDIGKHRGVAIALRELGRVRLLAGDLAGAADAAGEALGIFRMTGNRIGVAIALAELGCVRLASGDLPRAEDSLARALNIFRDARSRSGEGWALNFYAAVIAASGDRPRARSLYLEALELNRDLDKPDDEAAALEGLGECHLAEGAGDEGNACLAQALEIYERLGMKPGIERVRGRL